MKNVSLKLEEDLEQKLAVTAKLQHTTKSSVVREALERYLGDPGASRTGSCLDLAEDLVGRVDAPVDLSANPEYLQEFGE